MILSLGIHEKRSLHRYVAHYGYVEVCVSNVTSYTVSELWLYHQSGSTKSTSIKTIMAGCFSGWHNLQCQSCQFTQDNLTVGSILVIFCSLLSSMELGGELLELNFLLTSGSLKCGYLNWPNSIQYPITWTDLDLPNLREEPPPPTRYSFSFKASKQYIVV